MLEKYGFEKVEEDVWEYNDDYELIIEVWKVGRTYCVRVEYDNRGGRGVRRCKYSRLCDVIEDLECCGYIWCEE